MSQPFSHNNLGTVLRSLWEPAAGDQCYKCALIRLKKLGPERIDAATNFNNLGSVYHSLGDLQRARVL